jgi:hypothetical protein
MTRRVSHSEKDGLGYLGEKDQASMPDPLHLERNQEKHDLYLEQDFFSKKRTTGRNASQPINPAEQVRALTAGISCLNVNP